MLAPALAAASPLRAVGMLFTMGFHDAGLRGEAVPIEVDPSLNVTVPVGMPTPGGTTLTVATSGWLNTLGLELVSVVVVAYLTVCSKLVEVLPKKLESP